MKEELQPAPGWSRRRWTLSILAVFLGQVLLIAFFSKPSPPPLQAAAKPPVFRYLGDAVGPEWLDRIGDPTLFALISRHGFSADAWLRPPVRNYQLTNWTEPPQFLPPASNALGTIAGAMTKPHSANTVLDLKMPPKLADVVVPTLQTQSSSLRLEWDGEERKLLNPAPLPVQQEQGVLTNTIVQVGITLDGTTFVARILEESGSPKADQDALRWARQARFEPIVRTPEEGASTTETELHWGKLIFQWFTDKPNLTNQLAPPKA